MEGHGVRDYRLTFSGEDLARTPTWAEDAENPPLSARKAIRLATAKVSEITEDAKKWRWESGEATLVPAGGGKWFWQVNFGGGDRQQAQSLSIQLVVLMDGTVPEPTLDKEHPAE